MKNLQKSSFQGQKQPQTTDGSLSRLFFGFLERKISPQTIADILRVQISESHVSVNEFQTPVCNRLLESLTYANSIEGCSDLIIYFSEHAEFPQFLSSKATLGALRSLFHHVDFLIKKNALLELKNVGVILERLSEHLLNDILYHNQEDRFAMAELGILVRNIYPVCLKFMNGSMYFQNLCFLLRARQSFQEEGFFPLERRKANLQDYSNGLNEMIGHFDQHPFLIRNVILGIQKDLCFLFEQKQHFQSDEYELLYQDTKRISQSIFHYIVTLYKKDKSYVMKLISNWALDIPVAYEQARFFTRIDWRWIRTLAEQIWDDSLKEAPFWVVDGAHVYCALIFHCAPAQWLQKYSWILLEPIYHQSLEENFSPSQDHFHYVEFLLRNLRKKSPLIASHVESLHALSLLTHLTQSESSQYEMVRMRFEGPDLRSFSNPIAGALEIMTKILKETAES